MQHLHESKSSFENGVQYAWDATSLDLAQTCARKYYYKMILGIRPKEESVHLLFGGLYAKALESFYKQRALGESIEDATRTVVRDALVASWQYELEDAETGRLFYLTGTERLRMNSGDFELATTGKGHAIAFNDPKKTRANLIRTIVWYIEQFAIETPDGLQTYHLQNGEPACELSFALEFTDSIIYCGHLDRVVSMADKLYVMDQKSTGSTVGAYYFSMYSPNNQMSGYSFAGQAVLHSPVSGVIIDAAQIAINYTRFERGITTRTKEQLTEWHNGVVEFLGYFQRLSEWAGDSEIKWPMNPTACGYYGGCEFRLLCQKSPQVRHSYIQSDFVQHNWDPIERR